ncbi:hypothetical protein CPC08DRAFT_707149 [Agrocybe pediades]|nr:hypothetical protein CPC08DRAFT_707149 [Agrocybe pediades]
MSHSTSGEFVGTNPIDRIDSGETDESPFASNLVTPTDEQGDPSQGIHERIDAAKSLLGYFASRSFSGDEIDTSKAPISNVDQVQPSIGSLKETQAVTSLDKDSAQGRNADEPPDVGAEDSVMSTIHSIISSLSSSESIFRPVTGDFYTLPNDHISVYGATDDEDNLSSQTAGPESLPSATASTKVQGSAMDLTGVLLDSLSHLIVIGLRVLLFVPWCITVGGALLLAPGSLQKIAFGTGYVAPLTGIQRYAHWANYGFQHVVAFLTFLGAILWFYPNMGLLALGGLLAQFCYEWHGFLEDTTIPLGKDDYQTVYLLAKTTWLSHDKSVNLKIVDGDYYSTMEKMPEGDDMEETVGLMYL